MINRQRHDIYPPPSQKKCYCLIGDPKKTLLNHGLLLFQMSMFKNHCETVQVFRIDKPGNLSDPSRLTVFVQEYSFVTCQRKL